MQESHAEPDNTRQAASVIITNARGEVLLGQRGPESRNQIGSWENSGGLVEVGEDPIVAAARELSEERSIEVNPADLKLVYQEPFHEDESGDWILNVYMVEITDEQVPQITEPEKCSELRWVAKVDLKNMQLATYTAHDFQKLGWI